MQPTSTKWTVDGKEEFPELNIHPEDLEAVWKCGIAAMRHVFNNVENCRHIKFVRNFRAKIYGQYRKVNEEYYVLETDSKGNPWLSISNIDIALDQNGPFDVQSKIIDIDSGESFMVLDIDSDAQELLSKRNLNWAKMHNI